jgi:hypothetical protein
LVFQAKRAPKPIEMRRLAKALAKYLLGLLSLVSRPKRTILFSGQDTDAGPDGIGNIPEETHRTMITCQTNIMALDE